MNKICLSCGTKFSKDSRKSWAAYNKQQYCSPLCRNKSRIGVRKGEIVYCDNCGTEIYRRLSTIQAHNFCNRKCFSEWQYNYLSGENSPLFGRQRTLREKENMSIGQLGNKNSAGPRPSIRGGNNPFWGKHHSKKTLENLRLAGKNNWLCSEYVLKQMKSRGTRPNQKELWLEKFIQELNLPYRYVGCGEFILGGKCPDFLNTNGQKKLIELYGDYFHKGENPQERIDYFKNYGFHTLILWEREFKNPTTLKEKLLHFEVSKEA